MPDTLKKPLILFVDDDPHFLGSISRSLRKLRDEWDLIYVEGVDQAIDIARGKPPDVVISDYSMPIKSGFDLVRELRTIPVVQDAPIIIVTGGTDETAKRRALDLGATDLLSKPVSREDLIARIRSSLRLKEYQDTIRKHTEQLEQCVRERTHELELSRLDIIWRLAKAGEYRDEETGNHIIRVGHYSRTLSERLGLPYDLTQRIFLGAPLHDIGKIGVPDNILLKPGKLDPDERAVIEKHCEIGAKILAEAPSSLKSYLTCLGLTPEQSAGVSINPLLQIAGSIALGHHERWNGSGYPRGLRGEAIPLECRIVAIADTYDALRSKRPYKPRYSREQSLDIILRTDSAQFDPQVLSALEDSIDEIEMYHSGYSDHES